MPNAVAAELLNTGPNTPGTTNGPTASSAAVVRCVNVVKTYHMHERNVTALSGVNLEIASSGFFAIMGASGSGKSTLMHLLGGLDKPDSGEVFVGGQAVHNMSEKALTAFRRTSVGIVFQQFNLIPTLTARENVELPGLLAGQPASELRDRSTRLLDALGVGARGDHRPDALSGGEQQRVAIARALLFSPKVLLADEPTGNLDSASSAKLWSLLKDLAAERAMTVVMVTHEPSAAANCEHIFVMRDGRLHGHIVTEGLDAAGVASRYQQLVRSA